jgi:septal ring factor EnvC (AmiA/AmiB activator)
MKSLSSKLAITNYIVEKEYMITKLDVERLQSELAEAKSQIEALRSTDTDKAQYETQIADLTAEVELLKTVESITATEVYKSIVAENEANKQKISELEESIVALQVNKEENDNIIDMRVMERLASAGVPPIPVAKVADTSAFGDDIVAQYNEIKDGNKQRAFWVEHRDELIKHLRKV